MVKKIKVLQVGKFFQPYKGGIELVSLGLAEALNSNDIICDVLCISHDNANIDENFNYHVFRAKSILNFGSTSISIDFIKIFKRIADNYDIIHLHLPNPMAHLAIMLCRPKAKIVLHWHSDIIRQKKLLFFYRPLLKRLVLKASAIIGATKSHVDESDFSEYFNKKKFIIPYIFDYETLIANDIDNQAVDEIRKKHPNKKILFSIGRHVYYKGFENLVMALKSLSDDYVVIIGGTGPEKEFLHQIIRKHGLIEKAFLIGRLSDKELIDYLDACSIFVMSSNFRSEMFGMVQLEAFARSKPVICSDIPRSGVPYVGKHEVTGLTVPINSPNAIAEAVEEILSHSAYQNFCDDSFQWLQSEYAYDKLLNAHIQVYEAVLKERH